MADIITQPIKFLNATVLSFNSTLGLGSTESTLSVDLVEDCEASPPDQFLPAYNLIEVGAPVYFSTAIDGSGFNFGGVLTNWSVNQGSSGRVYNVRAVDPRQLLDNTIVIIDSCLVGPITTQTNYFNVYAAYERDVLNGVCDDNVFGSSGSSERGMPYNKIISKLQQLAPTIYAPTGYPYKLDFSFFASLSVPEYYSVPGPSISILQLLQDVCNVLGLEFYVNLAPGELITIGGIDLKSPPTGFSTIIDNYNGIATELSYGEELRNEKTKALIFGEQQHYLTYVDKFDYFFGEDIVGNELVPIVPFANDKSGFWIKKRIDKLNSSLFKPLPSNGPYSISELDIRAAMSSEEAWTLRALDKDSKGGLNEAVRQTYVECNKVVKQALDDLMNNQTINPAARYKALADLYNDPTKAAAEAGKPKQLLDLQAIHAFVQNLGNTYYGKQWISKLNQPICVRQGENFQEKIFSDVPTGDGGWVDANVPILGLSEPELTAFRSDDNRINSFAVFNISGSGNPGDAKNNGSIGETPSSDSFSSESTGE